MQLQERLQAGNPAPTPMEGEASSDPSVPQYSALMEELNSGAPPTLPPAQVGTPRTLLH